MRLVRLSMQANLRLYWRNLNATENIFNQIKHTIMHDARGIIRREKKMLNFMWLENVYSRKVLALSKSQILLYSSTQIHIVQWNPDQLNYYLICEWPTNVLDDLKALWQILHWYSFPFVLPRISLVKIALTLTILCCVCYCLFVCVVCVYCVCCVCLCCVQVPDRHPVGHRLDTGRCPV